MAARLGHRVTVAERASGRAAGGRGGPRQRPRAPGRGDRLAVGRVRPAGCQGRDRPPRSRPTTWRERRGRWCCAPVPAAAVTTTGWTPSRCTAADVLAGRGDRDGAEAAGDGPTSGPPPAACPRGRCWCGTPSAGPSASRWPSGCGPTGAGGAGHARPHRGQRAVAQRRPGAGQRPPAVRPVWCWPGAPCCGPCGPGRSRSRTASRASGAPWSPSRWSTPATGCPTTSWWRRGGGRWPAAGDAVAPRTIHEAILEGGAGRWHWGPERREVDPLPPPVHPAAGRPRRGAEPDRVLGPPHQLRRGRPAHRAARRLLRGPGGGRRRADHHRGALDPPHRLALREAHPRLPPRGGARLPADHRGRPPPRHAGLRPDQPQRRPGQLDVQPPAGVGALAGARPAVPRGAQGGRPARDRRDRGRLRRRGRALPGGRLRRHRAAVLAQLDRAGLPVAGGQPPHRPLRRLAREPGPPAARDRRGRPRGDRAGWRSACGCAATS